MSTYCSFLYISIYGGGTEITATPDSLLTATPRLGKNAAREIQEQTASLFTSENPAAPATMSKIFPRGKRKKKRPRLGAWGKREFEERTGVLTGHNCSHAVSYGFSLIPLLFPCSVILYCQLSVGLSALQRKPLFPIPFPSCQ